MGLSIDAVFGSFLVHGEDPRLPFRVGAWDTESDVGDDSRVVAGNALSDHLYKYSSLTLVVESSCQFGFLFHLSEEEVGGPGHSEFAHLLLMNEFDCGVAELFMNQTAEQFPVWESVSRTTIERGVLVFVLVVIGGGVFEFVVKVYPPILGGAFE